AALAAWAVPWPMLTVPVELPASSPIVEWRVTLSAALDRELPAALDSTLPAASASTLAQPAGMVRSAQRAPVGYLVVLLFLPGLLRLVNDAVALRASLATWRKSSRS